MLLKFFVCDIIFLRCIMQELSLKVIAKIKSDFKQKFGLPRQSGLTSLKSYVIFQPEYSDLQAVRGLEGFSHVWLLWHFSEVKNHEFSPTVRPPRLGGNKRIGVFATRSPFRPNPIGLSCVKLLEINQIEGRVVLTVEGADLMDGTPIFDVKPYIPYADSKPQATGGFVTENPNEFLSVEILNEYKNILPSDKLEGLIQALERDPRPAYHSGEREYTFDFDNYAVTFTVKDKVLYVLKIEKL